MEFVQNELENTYEWQNKNQAILQLYGDISWQHSIIDLTSLDHYNISIPIIKNNIVTAQIIFVHHPNHYHFDFYPSHQLDEIYLNNSVDYVEGDGALIYALSKLNFFDYYLSDNKNFELSAFILEYVSAHQNDIVYRGSYSTIEWYGYYLNENGQAAAATAGEISVFIECESEPPFFAAEEIDTELPPSRGGGENSTSKDPDEEEENSEEDDCAKDILTIEALAVLDNTSITDPCNPDRDIIEELKNQLCETTGPKTVLDTEAVLGALGDFMNEGGSSIVVPPDVAAACPCFEKIINRLSNSFNSDFLSEVVCGIKGSKTYRQTFRLIKEGEGDGGFHNSISYDRSETTARGVMQIPESACKQNDDGTSPQTDIEIGAAFIHEFLHRHFTVLLLDKYPNGLPANFYIPNSNDPEEFIINTDYWLQLSGAFNATQSPPSNNQHVLFFTHLLNLIAEGLQQMAGTGTSDDYLYYAHLIVNTPSIAEDFGSELGLPSDLSFDDTERGEYYGQMFSDWNAIGREDLFSFDCGQ